MPPRRARAVALVVLGGAVAATAVAPAGAGAQAPGAFFADFTLSQRGLPRSPTPSRRLVRVETSFAGRVTFPASPPPNERVAGQMSGSFTQTDVVRVGRLGRTTARRTITAVPTDRRGRPLVGRYTDDRDPRERRLDTTVRVTSSTDPACPVGRLLEIRMTDDGTLQDYFAISNNACPGRKRVFQRFDTNRLAVAISLPRPAPATGP